ncbi:MAG TPA: protein kinase [Opitutaceae bacterium]
MPDHSVPRIPDFNMLRRIGGGSYGVVWIARSLTGIYRAVKVVDRARFNDARPFLRELDGITRFQQTVGNEPRQLALMHVGRDDEQGIFYYVMELADDVDASTDINPDLYVPLTLKALRERRHRLPAAECVRLGIELARALAGLHAAGLIHRDVKPSNIIFVNGVPKLADVGLVSSSDHTLTSLGTPGYAPPEGAGTMEADVYGLGKILYELATGCPTMDFPRLPAEVTTREDTPLLLELNEVLLRACHPDPRERYPSAQAMLDDLLLLQAGKSVKELMRAKHRLRVLARASGVAALLALVALGVLGWMNYRVARQLAAQEAAARQQAERDERLARYSADLHLAQLALNGGDFGVARSALRRQIPAAGEPDLRGIEWRALWNETAGDAERVLGEVGGPPVRALAVAPGEKWLIAQEGEAIRRTVLWDLQTGARRLLADHTFGIAGITDNGNRVVVGTPDRKLEEIDITTGRVTAVAAVSGRVLQNMGDGKRALLGEIVDGIIRLKVLDLTSRTEVASWQSSPEWTPARLGHAALSPDGTLLAAALFTGDGATRRRGLVVWSFTDNRPVLFREGGGQVTTLCFSPDNSRLAVTSAGSPITLVSVHETESDIQIAGNAGLTIGVRFSPDGRRLYTSGEDQRVQIWDLGTQTLVAKFAGHEAFVHAINLDSVSGTLISGGDDGTIRVWPARHVDQSSEPAPLWASTLGDIVFAPQGRELAGTAADGSVHVFDAITREQRLEIADAFHPLAFVEGRLFSLNRSLELVGTDLATGATQLLGLRLQDPDLLTVATSSNGRFVALGTSTGVVELWDRANGRVVVRDKAHSAPVWAIAFAPGAERLATGDRDGEVLLWEVNTSGASVNKRLTADSGCTALIYSPGSNRLMIGRNSGALEDRDATTGELKQTRFAHSRGLWACAFSHDATRLITAGHDHFMIYWSLPELRLIATSILDRADGRDSAPYKLKISDADDAMALMDEGGGFVSWSLQ